MKSIVRTWRLATVLFVAASGATTLSFSPAFSSPINNPRAVANCTSAQLHVTHGAAVARFLPEGRKITTTFIFRNTGPTCAIWGSPNVRAAVGKMHVAVGPWATNLSAGVTAPHHIVARGAAVKSKYSAAVYYSLGNCHPTYGDGVVVALHGFVKPLYLALPITVCTGTNSETTQLIAAGTAG